MEGAPKTLVADGAEVAGGNYLLPGRRAVEQKYLEKAAPLMEGEIPQAVFRGKTGMSVWLLLALLVPLNIVILLIWILITRDRLVIVTDRRIHILRPGSVRQVPERVATLSRPAEAELTRFGLKLGEEKKIYATLGTSGAMKEAAALGQQPPG